MTIPYQSGTDSTIAQLLDTNINISTLANGDTLVYNSTTQEWENGAGGGGGGGGGTASDVNDLGGMNFSTLANSELLKKVDANNVGNSYVYATSTTDSSTTLQTNIPLSGPFNLVGGKIQSEVFDTTKTRVNITTGISTTGLTITSDGNVGIGVPSPEEALDIEGNIQLASGGTGKIKYKDASVGHIHSELDSAGDGTNGGKFIIKTKVDGSSAVTEKLTINNIGAIGLGATPDFGTSGNFLMSKGSGQAPEWFVPTTRIITSVKKTTTQTFTSGNVTKITGWDTPHVDIGTTGWSNANSRYTIQRTGTYRIYLKAIISNTGNAQAELRYLNIGMLIYDSAGGSPLIQDLDTTTLVNVDNFTGNAERGSGDYSIIRTFNAGQYIEFQVGSLQATGDYKVESGVFNIEELNASYVAGIGQFLPITGDPTLTIDLASLRSSTIELASTPATADPVRTFSRLKTTYQQILSTDAVSQSLPNPNENQPVSCQGLLDSTANAVIASTDPNGRHLLPPSGSVLQTRFNNLNNYSQHVSSWGDIKVGNFTTAFTNNNTLDQWLPLYNQSNQQQLFTSITLNDPSRPIRIDANVNLLYNDTTVGFRIVVDDGTTSIIAFGSQAWRTSNGSSDTDTAPYTCNIVHTHNGGANLTITIEGYVRSNAPGANPYFFINPVIMPPGTIGTGTLLVTEL